MKGGIFGIYKMKDKNGNLTIRFVVDSRKASLIEKLRTIRDLLIIGKFGFEVRDGLKIKEIEDVVNYKEKK